MRSNPSTPETRIPACSIRLLGVQLDAAEAATSEAVAYAIERLADALVTWHDAIVSGEPDHAGRAQRPDPGPSLSGSPPRELDLGALEQIAVATQVSAREVDWVARDVARHADAVADGSLGGARTVSDAERLGARGADIAQDLHALAAAVAQVGVAATAERRQPVPDAHRAARVIGRAEQALRRTADGVGHPRRNTIY
ncbi:hypothetical protein [Demetria terragena]|uniref:hypothetical protein n=1 Tax=Demetria terragena TaxID=63959 RepID=UPI0003A8B7E1|nr:hypothetical protein [Demetria terragena]